MSKLEEIMCRYYEEILDQIFNKSLEFSNELPDNQELRSSAVQKLFYNITLRMWHERSIAFEKDQLLSFIMDLTTKLSMDLIELHEKYRNEKIAELEKYLKELE